LFAKLIKNLLKRMLKLESKDGGTEREQLEALPKYWIPKIK
jgi:hypothetical protein